MKKNNLKIENKYLLFIIIPIIAGAVILFYFLFLNQNSTDNKQLAEEPGLLIPEIKEEESLSKKDLYDKEKKDKKRKLFEEENSYTVKEEDFFRELTEEKKEPEKQKKNVTQADLASRFDQEFTSNQERHNSTYTSVSQNNNNSNFQTNTSQKTQKKVIAVQEPEEERIHTLYKEAITTKPETKKTTVASAPASENIKSNNELSNKVIQEEEIFTDNKRRRKKQDNTQSNKNLITACIHSDQTVTNGTTVSMRLLEDFAIGSDIIPKNTLFYGTATIGTDRIQIAVNSLKYNNNLYKVKFTIYDNDAIQGLNLPDNIKKDLAKQTSKSTIDQLNVNTGSGGVVGDLINTTASAVKSVVSSANNEIRVTLKRNHQIFIQNGNN